MVLFSKTRFVVPLAVLVIVSVSVPASVVNSIPEPAATVNVSDVPSATMSDCPETVIVSNKF